MFTKSKIVLASALVLGLASAASAETAAPDSIRNYGPVAGQAAARLIEGRNIFVRPALTAQELWFKRASDTGNY